MKINHEIIVADKLLSKMGVSPSDNCNFCEFKKELYITLFMRKIKSIFKHCDKIRLTT